MLVMNLQHLLQAIEELPADEFQRLRNFVEAHHEALHEIRRAKGTPEERIAALDKAFTELREGLSQEDLKEIVEVMNYEYVLPVKRENWR